LATVSEREAKVAFKPAALNHEDMVVGVVCL
jgi:hypothetical protein